MKRWLILSFLFLIIIPLASAALTIEGPSKDSYNLGDKIIVNGYILEERDMFALFKLDLNCEEKAPLLIKTISLKANEKQSYTETVPIPVYLTGTCTIRASLEFGGQIIEQIDSRTFELSKELNGNFEVKEKLIQLGKDIIIEGAVFKLDGTNVDGLATLYFKQNDTTYWVDTIHVVDGKFTYIRSSLANPPGEYSLEVMVTDIYGNLQSFTNITKFTLVGEIYVFAKSNKPKTLPGDTITIFGEAKTILQESIEKANIILSLNDTRYTTILENSEFSYKIDLPKNIKTGRHLIHVIVEDDFGNVGETDADILVAPIPTELKVEIQGGPFKPNDTIVIIPLLYDQAGELVKENISIELFNPNNKKVLSDVVETNTGLSFEFPKYSLPGAWAVKSYAAGLEHEDQFFVEGVTSLGVSLVNQTLYLQNIGNDVYKEPIKIRLEGSGQDITIVKKIKLKPKEIFEINLAEEISTGTYDVTVNGKTFENVKIIGVPKVSYDFLYYIGIILAVLLFYLFLRKKKRKKKVKREPKLVHKKPKIEEKPELKKDYIKDFRERVLRDIAKRESEAKRKLRFRKEKPVKEYVDVRHKKEGPKRGGLFSMFD